MRPEKDSPLPLLLFPGADRASKAWIGRLKKEGRIRPIGARLYTSVKPGSEETVVRQSWGEIVSHLFPHALLSHRSALEFKPSPAGIVYLTATTSRLLTYPGLTLKFMKGPPPREDDAAFLSFRASSRARAFLENYAIAHSEKGESKTLPPEELEKKLEELLRFKGEKELNRLRDEAKKIAKQFGWEKSFAKLNQTISALLGTKPAKRLKSQSAIARALGRPYDPRCVERFGLLAAELHGTPLDENPDRFGARDHFRNKAFFESYFSNYIEGTTFEIEEAEEIVFEKKIPKNRPKDAHDILATYSIVSNPNELKRLPKNSDDLRELLQARHFTLMKDRPEANPGRYKDRPNRAGQTHFGTPELIEGTLDQGFKFYKDLPSGLAASIYIMFLIAEVHPFTDGNGRIARVFMNAELYAQGLSTIIIPNVYRDDYLGALRALSRQNRPRPLIQMLTRAHEFSHIEFSPYQKILKLLKQQNWFEDPDEAKLIL